MIFTSSPWLPGYVRLSSSRRDIGRHSNRNESLDEYSFNLVNSLKEYDDGRWTNERIDRNESWGFDGTNLIQQEFKRYGTEVATFSDADGDGIFSKVSEVFNPVVAAAGTEVF